MIAEHPLIIIIIIKKMHTFVLKLNSFNAVIDFFFFSEFLKVQIFTFPKTYAEASLIFVGLRNVPLHAV